MFGAGGAAVFGLGAVFSVRYIGNAQMRAISRDFRRVRNDMKGSTAELARFDAGMRALRWAGAAVVITAVARHIAGLYATSEENWAKIRTITGESIRDLESQFNAMVLGTRFITDLHKSEAALYDLLSAGVPQEHSVKAMEMAGTLAKATLGSIDDSVAALASSYNLFFNKQKDNIDDFSQAWADSFATTVRLYQTKLPQLSKQFNVVAGQAAIMGHSIHDTLSVVGALITGGLGNRSGRGWSRFLMQLGKAEDELNIKLTYQSGLQRGMALPPLELIDKLVDYFGGTRLNVQQQRTLVKAFDAFGARAIITAMLMRDRIKEAIEYDERFGESQRMAMDATNALNEQRARTKVAMQIFANTLTRDATPALTKFSSWMQKFFGWAAIKMGAGKRDEVTGKPEGQTIGGILTKWSIITTALASVSAVIVTALEHFVRWVGGAFFGLAVKSVKDVGGPFWLKWALRGKKTKDVALAAKTAAAPIIHEGSKYASVEAMKRGGGFVSAGLLSFMAALSNLWLMFEGVRWYTKGMKYLTGHNYPSIEPVAPLEGYEQISKKQALKELQSFVYHGGQYYKPSTSEPPPINITIENNYAEAPTKETADKLANETATAVKRVIEDVMNNPAEMDYDARRYGLPYSTVPFPAGGMQR